MLTMVHWYNGALVHWYNGTMYIVLLLALVTFSIVFNCVVVLLLHPFSSSDSTSSYLLFTTATESHSIIRPSGSAERAAPFQPSI